MVKVRQKFVKSLLKVCLKLQRKLYDFGCGAVYIILTWGDGMVIV